VAAHDVSVEPLDGQALLPKGFRDEVANGRLAGGL